METATPTLAATRLYRPIVAAAIMTAVEIYSSLALLEYVSIKSDHPRWWPFSGLGQFADSLFDIWVFYLFGFVPVWIALFFLWMTVTSRSTYFHYLAMDPARRGNTFGAYWGATVSAAAIITLVLIKAAPPGRGDYGYDVLLFLSALPFLRAIGALVGALGSRTVALRRATQPPA